jgi:hypothetical protein
MNRLHTLFAAAALLTAPAIVSAQSTSTGDMYNASRFTVEPYLSQAWVKNDVTDKYNSKGGFGARVMFGHATATQALSTFFTRVRTGAFATYASAGNNASQVNYGVQADFPLFATPATAGFYLDPFVSFGLGGIHSSTDNGNGTNITSNDFAFTPAVGTLIPITGQIKFRGDLRDAILFGNNTTNNFIAEGGISIGF